MFGDGTDLYTANFESHQELMKYIVGPMTKNASDLTYLYKIIYSDIIFKEKLRYPKVPFDGSLHKDNKKLKIGILNDINKLSTLSPTADRALEIAAQILQDNEHEVENVDLIHNIEEQSDNIQQLTVLNSVHSMYKAWHKHKDWLRPSVMIVLIFTQLPAFIIKGIAFCISFLGEKRTAGILKMLIAPNTQDIKTLICKRYEDTEKVIENWKNLELDAILIPTYPTPAFKPECVDEAEQVSSGYKLPPYWQFPSGNVPITVVKENEQNYEDKTHKDRVTQACIETMKSSKGLPMGVEVCCLPYKDEQVLRIMEIIEKGAKFHEKHPYPKIE